MVAPEMRGRYAAADEQSIRKDKDEGDSLVDCKYFDDSVGVCPHCLWTR
jgi:hypothetical protein